MRVRRLIALICIPIACWFITKYVLRPHTARVLNAHFAHKRIALIIAHPDDEAMFFGPFLNALRKLAISTNTGISSLPETSIRIICLSTGNADNLGETRMSELKSSAARFGVPAHNVFVFDDPRTQDAMGLHWPIDAIAEMVGPYLADIDVVVTFDQGGVSGHSNHISIADFVSQFLVAHGQGQREVWALQSVNILRKYASFLDIPFTYVYNRLFVKQSLVVASDVREYANTRDAMTKAHISQMRWFRWGWISLSRYMVVNDLHLL